ncbi:hypothetical protein [Sphingopyxis sp.]|uniref:hypothetical protein n=1 Tax=Sphingopyxis sp. TaxID=1908224 RepID=UPI0025E9B594|nr:hypothetical protein [Sphingopyxis sp.]
MAVLLRGGDDYAPDQIQAMRKVAIGKGKASILAPLAIVDDKSLPAPGEIGLGEQAFRRLGLSEGREVTIRQASHMQPLPGEGASISGPPTTY